MEVTVDLSLMVFAIIMGLGLCCLFVHYALQSGSALAWLAATMVDVGIETLVIRFAAETAVGMIALSLLVPFAYFFATHAVRQAMSLNETGRRVKAIFGALISLSLLLIAIRAPLFLQCIPFQLAAIVIFFDTIKSVWLMRSRDLLGTALLFLCSGSLLGLVIRVPMFPLVLGQPTPFPIMEPLTFEQVFMHCLSFFTSGLALIVVAKIVGDLLSGYRQSAERDPLTGLLNRRVFDEILDRPATSPGAVIMADIDHFKSVNDVYGHAVGDEVIQAFACILSHFADYVGRMGGEEFALILHDVDIDAAAEQAEVIRTGFHHYRSPSIGDHVAMSASFGVAAFEPGQPVRFALDQADKALYAAKSAGRNRLEIADATDTVGTSISKAA